MNYQETLSYIHSFGKFGSRLGLERIKSLMEYLGNPQDSLKCIHVAGTNGKGSTSRMIASVLTESGYRCGLYTSPYVIEFGERIQIDGKIIGKEDLCHYIEKVKAVIDTYFTEDIPTEFELITAAAFCYYADKKVDFVVLEVGLGGRLDATNIIKSPLVSVITKIDLDHTAILGETLSLIAGEKAGIIKEGCNVVTTCFQDAEALAKIESVAKEKHSSFTVTSFPKEITVSIKGTEFTLDGNKYKLRLIGRHQADNAGLAIAAIKASGIAVTQQAIADGVYSATMPARTEIISFNPFVMLDGSHNPAGISALFDTLNGLSADNAVAIIGMMADKDADNALKIILPKFSDVITVTVESNPRTLTADALAEKCKPYVKNVFAAPSYEAAITMADGVADGRPIIVFGSLYLSGDIREKLKEFFL